MDDRSRTYIFFLPYHIDVDEGQINENIEKSVLGGTTKLAIHPPESHFDQDGIWTYDSVQIDVTVLPESAISSNDVDREAEKYFRRFLGYCRYEAKQIHINPRRGYTNEIHFVEGGRERKELMIDMSGAPLTDSPLTASPIGRSIWTAIQTDLADDTTVPFQEEMMLDAAFYMLQNDYRMAVVSAAMGIEAVMTRYLVKELGLKLVSTGRVNQSQVDKFVDELSNRLLVTVGLGLTSTIDRPILEGCRETMQLRNDILHGKKKSTSSEEARKAIESLQKLVSAIGEGAE